MISKKAQYIIFLSYLVLVIFGGIYYIWKLKLNMNLNFYIVVLIINFIIIMFGTKVKYGSYLIYKVKDFNKHEFYYVFTLLVMSILTIHSLLVKLSSLVLLLLYNHHSYNVLTYFYGWNYIIFSFAIGMLLVILNKDFFKINHQSINYGIIFLYSYLSIVIILSFIFNYNFICYIVIYVIAILLPKNIGTDINKILNFRNPLDESTIYFLILVFLLFFMQAQILFPDYFISIITSNEITNFLLQFINGW